MRGGRLVFVTRALRDATGRPSSALLGQPPRVLAVPGDRWRVAAAARRTRRPRLRRRRTPEP